jgi:hypothetical protein
MPKVLLAVPETIECITRPIIFDVVRQLIDITDLPTNINILYAGDTEKAKQLGSAIGMSPGSDPNEFAFNDKITIEVEERYGETRVINEPVYGPGNLLIFEDSTLDIIMKPVYSTTDTVVTVKYRAQNRNAAIYWRDTIEARLRQRRDINMHTLTYSYNIPEELLYILKELHTLRENVDGYGESYDEYFEKRRHPRMTVQTNLNGAASLWSVPETQMKVQGVFDFETPEVGSKEDDVGTWTISFAYKFTYQRPTEIVMSYPLVVHNQVISSKFRPAPLKTEDDVVQEHSLTTRVLVAFDEPTLTSQAVHERMGFSIPSFDEFVPSSIPIKTMRLLTILFTIAPENPELFLSLKDLGSKKFSNDIMQYLIDESEYLTKTYMSAITVNFYRDEFLISPTPLRITKDLDVYGTTDINLRHQHHLRIGLVKDLFLLKGNALERLRNHGRAAIQILDTIDPTLKTRGFMPQLIGDNYISKASLLLAMENMRPANGTLGNMIQFGTVQNLIVETSRL